MIAKLYAQWLNIPPTIREPIKSGFVSFSLSIPNFAVAFYTAYIVIANKLGQPVTFEGYLDFVRQTWFATGMGVVVALYRAHQGYARTQQ